MTARPRWAIESTGLRLFCLCHRLVGTAQPNGHPNRSAPLPSVCVTDWLGRPNRTVTQTGGEEVGWAGWGRSGRRPEGAAGRLCTCRRRPFDRNAARRTPLPSGVRRSSPTTRGGSNSLPEQRDAIIAATRAAIAAGVTIGSVQRADFPLPSMAADIAAWSTMLESGLGFLLLRGFPIDVLSDAEVELAYVGLGTHLGRPVGQNAERRPAHPHP